MPTRLNGRPSKFRFMWPDCSLLLAGHDAVMPLTQEILSMATPDEERRFPLGRFELFILGGQTVGRAVYAPGWRWSEHIAPTAGTDWCEIGHLGLVIAGRAAVRMKDGTELQMGPGDLFSIPPGHDSWVLGDQEYVSLHFLGAQRYASPEGADQTDALAPVPARTASRWSPGARAARDCRSCRDQTCTSSRSGWRLVPVSSGTGTWPRFSCTSSLRARGQWSWRAPRG